MLESDGNLAIKWVSAENRDVSLLFHVGASCFNCKFSSGIGYVLHHYDNANCNSTYCHLCDKYLEVRAQLLDHLAGGVHNYDDVQIAKLESDRYAATRLQLVNFFGPVGELSRHVDTTSKYKKAGFYVWPEGKCSICKKRLGKGHDEEACKRMSMIIVYLNSLNLWLTYSYFQI